MRMFANLFLILFIADGGFSLFDEVVSLLSPLSAISEIRALLANVVMVLAVGIYFCLGIDKRLPKQVFLPLVLFLFCCPISALFFPSLSAKPAYGPIMAAGQVFLSGWLIYRFRKPGERRVTIPEAVFRAPFFSLRNTLIFTAANLILMPPVLVLLGLASANSYMEEHSSGFVRLGAKRAVHDREGLLPQ